MTPIYTVKKTIELQVTGCCSTCPMLLKRGTIYFCLGNQLIYRKPVIVTNYVNQETEAPYCPIKECGITIVHKPKIKNTI